jgi:hypothetical protein
MLDKKMKYGKIMTLSVEDFTTCFKNFSEVPEVWQKAK